MSEQCREFDRRGASWREHLESCPSCRRQLAAEGRLTEALGSLGAPRLSPGFSNQLRTRLAAERHVRPARLGQRLMQLYWLAAAVVTYLILTSLWTVRPGLGVAALASILVALATLSIPLLWFSRRFRLGLGDLMAATWW